MAIAPADLMKAKLQGIRTTLQRTPPSEKKNHVSIAVAHDFNAILKTARDSFPDIAAALPAQLDTTGHFAQMGIAKLTFLDLEALTEQVLNLLQLAEPK